MQNNVNIECRSVTKLLQSGGGDSSERLSRLYEKVKDQFAVIAARLLGKSFDEHMTVQLLDDAFLKLTNAKHLTWQNRASFYAAAAITMRRMVINHYRHLKTAKNNFGRPLLPLSSDGTADSTSDPVQIVELNETLERLMETHPSAMRVFDMSVFGGWTYKEIAEALDTTEAKIQSLMKYARKLIANALESRL